MTRFFDALGRFSVRFRYPGGGLWEVGSQGGVARRRVGPLRGAAGAAEPGGLVAERGQRQPADGALTSADQAAVDRLVTAAKRVPDVAVARETGVSPDGRAAQVQVLANVSGFGSDTIPLVDDLRDAIGQADPPAGLELHTAGQVATAVDNNSRSGETGNRTQQLSILFVLVLLLVVFRSVLAPVLTLLPALLVISVASPSPSPPGP